MTTETAKFKDAQSIDLTRLPAAVVQDIRSLVKSLRQSLSAPIFTAATNNAQPLRGRFAPQNLQITKVEIDEAQRETWSVFPSEFPEPNNS